MRKLILMSALLGFGFAAAKAGATGVKPADQQFFDAHIGQLVQLKPTPLDNPALAKVFSCRFYDVDVIFAGAGEKIVAARTQSGLVQMAKPSTTADMPGFPKLIKADFRLKSDEDAHRLQDALDVLYPISSGFGGEDARAKTIRHAGSQWTFVRGKFFSHLKGFVVTTNPAGVITNVKYSLALPKS